MRLSSGSLVDIIYSCKLADCCCLCFFSPRLHNYFQPHVPAINYLLFLINVFCYTLRLLFSKYMSLKFIESSALPNQIRYNTEKDPLNFSKPLLPVNIHKAKGMRNYISIPRVLLFLMYTCAACTRFLQIHLAPFFSPRLYYYISLSFARSDGFFSPLLWSPLFCPLPPNFFTLYSLLCVPCVSLMRGREKKNLRQKSARPPPPFHSLLLLCALGALLCTDDVHVCMISRGSGRFAPY